jgi:uncharacterized protein (DUF2147 family)
MAHGWWIRKLPSIFTHAKVPHVERSSGCWTHPCGPSAVASSFGGLTPDGPSQWNGGWFYDPKGDKTYNLKAHVENHDRISARIYKGIPLFGRTELLNRIESHSLAGWCAG